MCTMGTQTDVQVLPEPAVPGKEEVSPQPEVSPPPAEPPAEKAPLPPDEPAPEEVPPPPGAPEDLDAAVELEELHTEGNAPREAQLQAEAKSV